MGAKEVVELLEAKGYIISKTALRRINWYNYGEGSVLTVEKSKIIIKTEIAIKGIYSTLILYPSGKSELKMEFD